MRACVRACVRAWCVCVCVCACVCEGGYVCIYVMTIFISSLVVDCVSVNVNAYVL